MKTLGTKLDNELCENFIDCCNNNGKTVSEKIREMIKDEITFENNLEEYDKESKEDFRKIRKIIGTHDEGGWVTDDDGTPRSVEFVWLTEQEKKLEDDREKVILKN